MNVREQIDLVERFERDAARADRKRKRSAASQKRFRSELTKELERAVRNAGKTCKPGSSDVAIYVFGWLTGAADVDESVINRWLKEGPKS